jgi:diadenosine tetraphosphatase ApaH/serine/threonine PP2A family protein phosphatase
MKTGIMSDIHGNMAALEAVLTLMKNRGVSRYVCCGDIVGYGPDPNRCVETIRSLRPLCVAGNHDYGVVGKTSIKAFNDSAAAAALWTRKKLTAANRVYLENLPLTERLEPLLVVHASPSEPEEWAYLTTLAEAEEEMGYYPDTVCLVGHSHLPFAVELVPGQAAQLITADSFTLSPGAKYLINVGSVGQPRDGDPRACAVIYNSRTGAFSFHRVEYDIGAVQKKMRAADLPQYLIDRLAKGR